MQNMEDKIAEIAKLNRRVEVKLMLAAASLTILIEIAFLWWFSK